MVEAPAAHHIEYQRWGIHELVLRRTAMSSGAPPLPPDASCPFGMCPIILRLWFLFDPAMQQTLVHSFAEFHMLFRM